MPSLTHASVDSLLNPGVSTGWACCNHLDWPFSEWLVAILIPGLQNSSCDRLSRLQVPCGPVLRDGRCLKPVTVLMRLRG